MAISLQKKHGKKRPAMSEINVTPFVDVLLVLLIIFMVAAPMMTGSVDVNLPEGSGNPIKEDSQPISITIKANGAILIGDEPTELDLLSKKLIIISDHNFSRKIHVKADKKIDYGKVMEVVKNIGSAGFSQVILVTDLSQ